MRNGRLQKRRGWVLRLLSALILFDLLLVLVAAIFIALQTLDNQVRIGIVEGIVANLITTVSLTILGVSAFIWFSVIERRWLFRFFGINRNALGVRIYLSRLQVKPGGTEGTEPITTGYVGPTIVQIEYEAGLLLLSLFQPRALALIPDMLRELLSALFVTLSDIEARVVVTPKALSEMDLLENLVSIGGAIYNSVSQHYLSQLGSFYYFTKSASGERVMRARRSGGPDLEQEGRSRGHELACVQRLKDPDTGVTVFICAGLGSAATYGSVLYLAQHWRRLWRKYGDAEFGVCLAFDNQSHDEFPIATPRVIDETVRRAGQTGADGSR